MKRPFAFIFSGILLLLLACPPLIAQHYYPPAGEWERKSPVALGLDATKLETAVQFARENEYSGSRDLRIAILEGFQQEPYHKIVGPTKQRGGPAGLIVRRGYIVAEWGAGQLFPEEWIRMATEPSPANESYGYMWWLSENLYYAAGFGGNYIIVCPDQNMVMVTRWLEPSVRTEFIGKVLGSVSE